MADTVSLMLAKDAQIATLSARVAQLEEALRKRDARIGAMIAWLEDNQCDVFKRGLWGVLAKNPITESGRSSWCGKCGSVLHDGSCDCTKVEALSEKEAR